MAEATLAEAPVELETTLIASRFPDDYGDPDDPEDADMRASARFPEMVRLTNRGIPVWIESVFFDGTRSGGERVAGMRVPMDVIDPQGPPPTLVYRGGVAYCGWPDEGRWGLADDQEEVAVVIEFRRSEDGPIETYLARAPIIMRKKPRF